MSRVLSRAGQFAHVNEETIESLLDQIYSFGSRYRDDEFRDEPTETVERYQAAACDHFLMAAQAGLMEPHYDALGTVKLFYRSIGHVCPICFEVNYSDWGVYTLGGFNQFVCPSFLRPSPDDNSLWSNSLCYGCGKSISNWFWRNFGVGWLSPQTTFALSSIGHTKPYIEEAEGHSINYAAALAWIVKTPAAKRRLQENRHITTRFDPRKPLSAAA